MEVIQAVHAEDCPSVKEVLKCSEGRTPTTQVAEASRE
jgi:hypothetical protein